MITIGVCVAMCYMNLASSGQGCCQTSNNKDNTPPPPKNHQALNSGSTKAQDWNFSLAALLNSLHLLCVSKERQGWEDG